MEYMVKWKNKITGDTGGCSVYGVPMSKTVAEVFCDQRNKTMGDVFFFWIEPVDREDNGGDK